MKSPHFFLSIAMGLGLAVGGSMVAGQEYPSKAIRIVTSGAGGSSDMASRLIAQGISGPLAQPVVVENRGGNLQSETVARAAPDGYTLLLTTNSHWLSPLLQKVPYDPVADFESVSWVLKQPNVVVVHPSLPVRTVKELIALAKARPGELNYSSGATGGNTHLAAELFKALAAVDIVRVGYKNTANETGDLLSGQVHMTFGAPGSYSSHIKSGKVRAIAVTTAQPSPLFPGLPTVAAAGVPGYEAVLISAMFAPVKTPGPVIRRVNQEVVKVLNVSEVKEKFFNTGIEVVASSPDQLSATIKEQVAVWGKLIREKNIRAE